ncbi:NFU1 iron-sulfur cluster scaffold homolog, mitochondrial-like [Zophobas morio]|uniref:NFU1 iron-sulfur cluster scaffold homolog, mitochondrial-like n=1 Tax=Zophobas morio TaxID=2755281 RepID=UPI003082A417
MLVIAAQRFISITREITPNPNSIKFFPGKDIINSGTVIFNTVEDAKTSPLAKSLLEIKGVKSILYGKNWITVSKFEEYKWNLLEKKIEDTIKEFYSSGISVFVGSLPNEETPVDQLDNETILLIKEILDHKIRPFLQEDGGDVTFVDFKKGVLYLKLEGACGDCPSSTVTLKDGIENMFTFYVPEVKRVEQVKEKYEEVGLETFQNMEEMLKRKAVDTHENNTSS